MEFLNAEGAEVSQSTQREFKRKFNMPTTPFVHNLLPRSPHP